jgi:PKD repeat protein
VKWEWDLGDGTTGSTRYATHLYDRNGSYVIKLKVTTDNGLVDSTTRTIDLYNHSALELGADTTIMPGDTILLDASKPFESSITGYRWSTGATTPTIRVTTGGTYWVTVANCDGSILDTIHIRDTIPGRQLKAGFSLNKTGCSTLQFTDTSKTVGADIIRWNWDFGDNTADTLQSPAHTYSLTGNYTVTLVITNNYGEQDTVFRNVPVSAAPIVDLGLDSYLLNGDVLLGKNNPAGANYKYQWSTGDTARTVHALQPGVYCVKITDTNCGGQAADTVRILENDPGSIAAHIGLAGISCYTAFFIDSSITKRPVVKWEWQLGDGATDNTHNPFHEYQKNGHFVVKLKITTDNGLVDSTTRIIDLFNRSEVNLGADTTIQPGSSLWLDARKPFESPYNGYHWSTGQTTGTIQVTTPGTYAVRIANCGGSISDSIRVWLDTVPAYQRPAAEFSSTKTGCATFRFTDQSTTPAGTVARWKWNFGDNTTDTLQNPVHTYSGGGTYTVSLLAINSYGQWDTAYNTIILVTTPVFDLGRDTTLYNGQATLRPYPLLTGDNYRYFWSTGDSAHTIVVRQPGAYSLTITDKQCGTSAGSMIRVTGTGAAGITAIIGIETSSCTTVHFRDSSTSAQPTIKWYWQFGDGVTDTSSNPVHVYAADGQYLVKLAVTNSQGVIDSATRYINLVSKPNLDLGPDVTIQTGDTLVLNAGFPNTTCTWSTGETSSGIIVTAPGVYSVTVYYCNGEVSDSIHVYADSLPVAHTPQAQFTADKLQCTTVKFTDQSTTPAGTTIISRQWSFGDNTTDTLKNPVHTYSQRGTYTISLLIVNNEGERDTAFTTIYFAPAEVKLGADTTLAAGDSLLLDARKPEKLSGATYLWSTGATGPVITVRQPGIYWVKVTVCNTVVADTIVVSATDSLPAANIGNTTTVNTNDSLAVTASFDHSFNNNNVFTVQLLQGTNTGGKKAGELDGAVTNLATIPGTDPRISVKVTIPDTIPCGQDYRVRIVSSSPADTTDWSSQFAVVNTPVAILQQRGDSLFAGKALTYQWYFNGAALTGATTAAIRAKANGQYYVTVSNGGTCRNTSTTVNMMITAVPDVTVGENIVRAFPNPTAGLVYVRFEKPLLKPVDLIVHDTKGNTLYRKQVKDQLTEINLGTLPKGIYYLEVAGYGKQKAMRIILQ